MRFEDLRRSLVPWVICFTASLFFFYEFIQGNMFASVADNIMHDFHIKADNMAYLSSIYYLSNVIFLVIAGFILDRFSAKKTLLLAMMLSVLSTFMLAHTHSFYLALSCRFITGIGSAFCFLGPIRIASRWFLAQRMALVTGAIVTMAMSGGMLAQYPLTLLVVEVGWRNALELVGWLGVIMLGFMVLGIKYSPDSVYLTKRSQASILCVAKTAFCNQQNLGAALYASLMNIGIAVFGAMIGSLYLMQRLGIDKSSAALVNSMLFLGAIIGGPFIGWCSDRLGVRILPMKIGALVSLLLLFIILYAPVSFNFMALLFFLLGFFTASQVIAYALVAESNAVNITAMAVSVVSLFAQAGYIVYQNLFSTLLLRHGGMVMEHGIPVYSLEDYQAAVIILPLALGLALFMLFRLKETHCRQL